ncbi:fad dependent oxidoreductase superfamily [Ophiostoma piceae UAMH 11346]|uniref:Fad dependent oxidoreductase superfamily n=1 Tax=Ophiostoma piceae (strain UAMH 11346) TaxID=1262450 RepID=S3BWI4_OPHP1|nr:fad dependent oxidoreductase superfamily [Ophiostoma piceae UAMH 11346]
MSTVVVGAGIVGVSTAYYLSQNQPPVQDGVEPHAIHLVETTDSLFASASGFAGGFLARDWFAPAVAEVGALSFDQHRALADKYGGRKLWGYAESTSLSYGLPDEPGSDADPKKERRRGEDWLRQGTSRSTSAPTAAVEGTVENGGLPAWLHRRSGDSVEVLANDGTTGQVDPLLFCQFLLKKAQESGVQLHQPARVVSVGTSNDNGSGEELASVTIETGSAKVGGASSTSQTVLPCTKLVITAGAWTPRVFDALFPGASAEGKPLLAVNNYSGHSLVVRPPTSFTAGASLTPSCHAIFAAGGPLTYCPEIFGRANGTLYMAGLNSSTEPLPRLATDSVPDPVKLDDLMASCKRVLGIEASSEQEREIEIVRTGLCHRPATPWGFPLVLRMPDDTLKGAGGKLVKTKAGAAGGVFVAAGHGPWGISMAPGTGMVLAELVQGRPLSADLSSLGLR